MRLKRTEFPLSTPAGFEVDDTLTPRRVNGIDPAVRRRAATLVLSIGRGLTPEDCAAGVPRHIVRLLDEPLERAEADAWVDLVADALGLAGRPA